MDDPNITMEEYIQLMTDKARGHFETNFSAIVYNDALASPQNGSFEPTDEDYTFTYNEDSSSYKLIPVNDLKPEPVNDYVEINTESYLENIDIKPIDSVIYISKDTIPIEFNKDIETNHDTPESVCPDIRMAYRNPMDTTITYDVSQGLGYGVS
nr:hypothetical protein [Tanacetum cinerariifolium]